VFKLATPSAVFISVGEKTALRQAFTYGKLSLILQTFYSGLAVSTNVSSLSDLSFMFNKLANPLSYIVQAFHLIIWLGKTSLLLGPILSSKNCLGAGTSLFIVGPIQDF
jgi:hypothetical protein